MWILAILGTATILGLSRLPEARARLMIVPVILAVVGYTALKHGLL